METNEKCQKCNGIGIIYEKDGKTHTCFDCLKSGKLTNFHYKEQPEQVSSTACQKCHGTGIVKDASGNHTCWDCLMSGKLDNHSQSLPDHNIKI